MPGVALIHNSRHGDRRRSVRERPWQLVTTAAGTTDERYLAAQQLTGRTVALNAHTPAEAAAQVELLNHHTLDLEA